jgi:hypothetical protein
MVDKIANDVFGWYNAGKLPDMTMGDCKILLLGVVPFDSDFEKWLLDYEGPYEH